MLNIGVIGCGKIAQVRHIPEYAANENCTLTAFFSPNAKRAEDMAAKYGGKVYASAEELFADPEIDALVAARNQAKKEKNYAEADRIRDELKARGIEIIDTPQGTKWRKV